MQSTPTAPSPEAVLHLATLHCLAAAGFASTSRAASLSLSSVVGKYLELVGRECVERAHLGGRSKPGALDVVDALGAVGVDVEDVMNWAAANENRPTFAPTPFEALAAQLKDGLSMDVDADGPKMEYVPIEDDLEESEAETEDESADHIAKDDVEMDGEAEVKPVISQDLLWRPRSPDMSWLPPLPNATDTQNLTSSTASTATLTSTMAASAPMASSSKLSLIDKFKTRTSFASSSIASTFRDPPSVSTPAPALAPTPSSLPALLQTYAATANEPSTTLVQSEPRWQATEILRHHVASPLNFSPNPTLSAPLPGPRITPVVPSYAPDHHSSSVPISQQPYTTLSSVLHQIRSPYLPPGLRERLTSIRTPLALKSASDKSELLYGDPVRGPDEAALQRARGKPTEGLPTVEYRATWDQGPRGQSRWSSAELPTGKKVKKFVEGEDAPRRPEGLRPKVKLRLSEVGIGAGVVSAIPSTPGPTDMPNGFNGSAATAKTGQGESTPTPAVQVMRNGTPTPGGLTPTVSGGSGMGIRLKLGMRRVSAEGSASPLPPATPPVQADEAVSPRSTPIVNGQNGQNGALMPAPSILSPPQPAQSTVPPATPLSETEAMQVDGQH